MRDSARLIRWSLMEASCPYKRSGSHNCKQGVGLTLFSFHMRRSECGSPHAVPHARPWLNTLSALRLQSCPSSTPFPPHKTLLCPAHSSLASCRTVNTSNTNSAASALRLCDSLHLTPALLSALFCYRPPTNEDTFGGCLTHTCSIDDNQGPQLSHWPTTLQPCRLCITSPC